MTIVAAYTGVWGSILAADSRVTMNRQGNVTYHDVCQKVAPLGMGDGWIGFAGDVCTSVKFLKVALPYSEQRGLAWLNDQEEVDFLLKQSRVSAKDPFAKFLAVFRDKEKRDGFPIRRCHIVAFDSKDTTLRQKHLGFAAIGSGQRHFSSVESSIDAIEFANALNGKLIKVATMWFAHHLYQNLGRGQEPTVGGLFQLHYITQSGSGVIPYEKWIRLGRGLGTYVNMLFKDGNWIQYHASTQKRIPLSFPFSPDFTSASMIKNRRFDMRYVLGPQSPGVIPEPEVVTEYRLSDVEMRSIKLPPTLH